MPRKVYFFRDFICAEEHKTHKFVEAGTLLVPCETCGGDAILPKLYEQAHTIIGDEIDYIDHNLGREPIHIRSRAERRRLMKERGLEEFIRHTPVPGTDQSPYTTNWASRMDPYTLENARILVERTYGPGKAPIIAAEPEPEPVANAFSYVATPEQVRELQEALKEK